MTLKLLPTGQPAWLNAIGGRKFVLAIFLVLLSGGLFFVLDEKGAGELGVLLGFWAAVAGVHGASNAVAKRAPTAPSRSSDPHGLDELLEGEE